MRRAAHCCRRWASSEADGKAKWIDATKVDFGTMRVDVVEREELVKALAEEQRRYFREQGEPVYFKTGIEDPKTVREWFAKKLSEFDFTRQRAQAKTYGTRMGITTMNHISNPDWALLFGIKENYLEVSMWLWAIHMWMLQKRLWVLPEGQLIGKSIHSLYSSTSMHRIRQIYETNRERNAVQERIESLFSRNLMAFDESFHAGCQYRDALLMYALYRNSPFEHREEVPMYAWYTLVQYIRLHLAVFDRIPNEEFRKGYFYFYHPLDPQLFERPDAIDHPSYVPNLLKGKGGPKMPGEDEERAGGLGSL